MTFHSMSKIRDRELLTHFEAVVDLVQEGREIRSVADNFRYEMEGILHAINWERAVRFKEPISMVKLLKIETGAAGHCDYAHKLALYSKELVEAE